MGPQLLAVNWLDQVDKLSAHTLTSGKAIGNVAAIIFVLLTYARFQKLGPVLGAMVLAGLVLYSINNTDALQKNTKDTFTGMGGTPALISHSVPDGDIFAGMGLAGGGGGGGGSWAA